MASVKQQSGIGLVDVLVAAAIFAVGVLALVKLQGSLLGSGSDANARSAALSIAHAKLDDLHSFQQTNSGSATVFDFADIASNAGSAFGNQLAFNYQSLSCTAPCAVMPAGSIAQGDAVYTLAWTVTNQDMAYNTGTSVQSASTSANTCASVSAACPDQKLVVVTVTWTDRSDAAQSVSLGGIINSISSAASALVLGGGKLGGAAGGGDPQVAYTAGAAPSVIPVTISSGSRETTTPLPIIVQHGQTVENNVVSFSSINFANGKAQSKEDFTTLNCSCNLRTSGSGTDKTGKTVTKARTGVPSDNFQDPLCTTCCNDHHEASDRGRVAGTVTVTGGGTAVTVSPSPTTDAFCNNTAVMGGESTYVCTVKSGWTGTISASCGSATASSSSVGPVQPTSPVAANLSLSCSATSNAKTNAGLLGGACHDSAKVGCYDPYRTSTADYPSGSGNSTGDHRHYHQTGASSWAETTATSGTALYLESCRFKLINDTWRVVEDWRLIKLNAFDQNDLTNNSANVSSYATYVGDSLLAYAQSGTTPATWGTKTIDMSSAAVSTKDLMARAIYVGYLGHLTANQLSHITLDNIPFSEVNTTELVDWTPTADSNSGGTTPLGYATSNIKVASPSVADLLSQNTYASTVKGRVTETGSNPAYSNTVQAAMKLSNSGVSGTVGVDDQGDATVMTDTLTITVGGGYVISGTITATSTAVLSVTGVDAICTVSTGNTFGYSCTVASGWTGTISVSDTSNQCTSTSTSYSSAVTTDKTQNYTLTCTPSTRTISGTVTLGAGGTNPSVQGTLNASCSMPTTTSYTCTVTNNLPVIITATATGCAAASFNNGGANVTVDITSPTADLSLTCSLLTISGAVTSTGVNSVTGTNSASCLVATTSTSTTYTCSVPSGWTGTITASSTGAGCAAQTQTFGSSVSSSLAGQNFTLNCSHHISGSVNSTSANSISITSGTPAGASCAVTNANPSSTYSCLIPYNWTGTIQMTSGGSGCIAQSTPYAGVVADVSNAGYAFTCGYTITGAIGKSGSGSADDVTVSIGGTNCTVTGSNANSTYSCSKAAQYGISATASVATTQSGHTVSPTSFTVNFGNTASITGSIITAQ